jgi:hypothetical protein
MLRSQALEAHVYYLCDLGQVSSLFCTPFSSSVKGGP